MANKLITRHILQTGIPDDQDYITRAPGCGSSTTTFFVLLDPSWLSSG